MNPRILLLALTLSITPACQAGIFSFLKEWLWNKDTFCTVGSTVIAQSLNSTYNFFAYPKQQDGTTSNPPLGNHIKASVFVGCSTLALMIALVKLRGTHEYTP